ncbi:hypothetical protein DPMN_017660 [Dreissena polymorpha]|uniref:Uncharacterized protein n=1 Tax=Dreissena polymorpha TaxID=45954 RepID=A0A9D4NF91_DREPO|nr:hypothetical protein DPMN_017660 [Dreissena polymorpha]
MTLCRHPKPVPGHSKTICDVTKIVWAPVGQSKTVCDGFRRSPRPAGHLQEISRKSVTVSRPSWHMQKTTRQSATVPESHKDLRGTCMRLPDSVRRYQSSRPAAHLLDTTRQSTMVPRLSGHLQKNHRLCQTVYQTSGASARDSQTVGDDAKTVLVPEGDSKTVPDSHPDRRGTGSRLPDSL